jgi:hypothetical protein
MMHLRIPAALHDAIRDLASREVRSLNATAILLFTEAIDAREQAPSEPDRPRSRAGRYLRGPQ